MEFVLKSYKKIEFDSTLKNLLHENEIHVPGIVVTYNEDGSAGKTTAIVNDSIIGKLSKEQINELKSII